MKSVISAADLAPAVAPYSPGVVAGPLVFVCQGPIRPGAAEVVGTTIAEQAARTLDNIELVLSKVGASRADIAKMSVYLADMDGYAAMNEVYIDFFRGHDFPARIVIEAARLPLGLLVEMEAVAVLPASHARLTS
jgi:2-iminobutanoate/2-iminopropanoate deaminase